MRKPRLTRLRTAILLSAATLPVPALACPDCEYEACAWFVCGCVPKDQCVVQKVTSVIADALAPPRLVVTTMEKAVGDIGATVKKAFDDTIREAGRAANDVANNVGKAGDDTVAEAGRFGREVGTAGQALVHFAQNQVTGTGDATLRALQQIREGKVIDAIWHAGIAPIQIAEKSSSEAVLESAYLRAVGQVAANTYGGPLGAAAYSAWLTYKQTGDPSLAIRVGMLAGASAQAFAQAGAIDDTVKKTIVMGAIGGAGVAAAGGDENAVREAFLQAGAMVVIQDGFRRYTKHAMDPSPSEGEAYCISARSTNCTPLPEGAYVRTDEKGNFVVDMSKVDPKVPAVGLKDHTAYFSEQNRFMTGVSRIPGMQAMAIFHDVWAVKWDMGALTTPATILPAMVLTYTGFGAPYYDKLQATAVEEALKQTTPGFGGGRLQGEPAVETFNVKDAAVRLEPKAPLPDMLVHEVAGLNIYCYDGVLIKDRSLQVNPKLQMVVLDQCLRKSDLLVQRPAPKYVDACRILKNEGGHWRVVERSVFDRDYCTAIFRRMTEPAPDDTAAWLRADARLPKASTP